MSWARLDDQILDNPKILQAGPIGFALHVAAITYCSRNLTDGFVTYAVARRLLITSWTEDGDDGKVRVQSLAMVSGMSGSDGPEVIDHIIELLCEVGLWEIVEHGYFLHDYLEYNPSREMVLAKREASRDRVQAHRQRGKAPSNDVGNAASNGGGNAEGNGGSTRPPVPRTRNPVPVPESRDKTASPNGDARHLAEVGAVFMRVWNEHCDPLPRLRKLPPSRDTQRLMRQALEHFDGKEVKLGEAVARCALNDHYREHRYGVEAFCRHVARWAEPGMPYVAPTKPPIENPKDRQIREFSERWLGQEATA